MVFINLHGNDYDATITSPMDERPPVDPEFTARKSNRLYQMISSREICH